MVDLVFHHTAVAVSPHIFFSAICEHFISIRYLKMYISDFTLKVLIQVTSFRTLDLVIYVKKWLKYFGLRLEMPSGLCQILKQ